MFRAQGFSLGLKALGLRIFRVQGFQGFFFGGGGVRGFGELGI